MADLNGSFSYNGAGIDEDGNYNYGGKTGWKGVEIGLSAKASPAGSSVKISISNGVADVSIGYSASPTSSKYSVGQSTGVAIEKFGLKTSGGVSSEVSYEVKSLPNGGTLSVVSGVMGSYLGTRAGTPEVGGKIGGSDELGRAEIRTYTSPEGASVTQHELTGIFDRSIQSGVVAEL